MNKNSFLALSILCESGKRYAYVVTVPATANLFAVLRGISDAETANICTSKKAAQALCDSWNESYRKNGECLF